MYRKIRIILRVYFSTNDILSAYMMRLLFF